MSDLNRKVELTALSGVGSPAFDMAVDRFALGKLRWIDVWGKICGRPIAELGAESAGHPATLDRTLEAAKILRPRFVWLLAGKLNSAGTGSAAARLKNEHPWVADVYGKAYRAVSRFHEALDDLSRVIEASRDNAWDIARRGRIYLTVRSLDDAIAGYVAGPFGIHPRAVPAVPTGSPSATSCQRVLHRAGPSRRVGGTGRHSMTRSDTIRTRAHSPDADGLRPASELTTRQKTVTAHQGNHPFDSPLMADSPCLAPDLSNPECPIDGERMASGRCADRLTLIGTIRICADAGGLGS